jgi:hypothetical protein
MFVFNAKAKNNDRTKFITNLYMKEACPFGNASNALQEFTSSIAEDGNLQVINNLNVQTSATSIQNPKHLFTIVLAFRSNGTRNGRQEYESFVIIFMRYSHEV